MRMLDVWSVEVSGGVGAVRSSESVRWIDGDQRRSVQAGFSSLSCGLGTFRPRVPILNATTSQFPTTIKTIAFSGAGVTESLSLT